MSQARGHTAPGAHTLVPHHDTSAASLGNKRQTQSHVAGAAGVDNRCWAALKASHGSSIVAPGSTPLIPAPPLLLCWCGARACRAGASPAAWHRAASAPHGPGAGSTRTAAHSPPWPCSAHSRPCGAERACRACVPVEWVGAGEVCWLGHHGAAVSFPPPPCVPSAGTGLAGTVRASIELGCMAAAAYLPFGLQCRHLLLYQPAPCALAAGHLHPHPARRGSASGRKLCSIWGRHVPTALLPTTVLPAWATAWAPPPSAMFSSMLLLAPLIAPLPPPLPPHLLAGGEQVACLLHGPPRLAAVHGAAQQVHSRRPAPSTAQLSTDQHTGKGQLKSGRQPGSTAMMQHHMPGPSVPCSPPFTPVGALASEAAAEGDAALQAVRHLVEVGCGGRTRSGGWGPRRRLGEAS